MRALRAYPEFTRINVRTCAKNVLYFKVGDGGEDEQDY